jgi:hypothetical protein
MSSDMCSAEDIGNKACAYLRRQIESGMVIPGI